MRTHFLHLLNRQRLARESQANKWRHATHCSPWPLGQRGCPSRVLRCDESLSNVMKLIQCLDWSCTIFDRDTQRDLQHEKIESIRALPNPRRI